MAGVRYSVPGVPSLHAGKASSAFTPGLSWYAASGAVAYKYGVGGGPAQPIPVTARRDTQVAGGGAAVAAMGGARSSDAPDVWWPDQYTLTNYDRDGHAEHPGAGTPIRVYDPQRPGPTALLPVPAIDGRATYQRDSARLARRTILNRVKALPWFPRTASNETGTWNG